MDLYLEKLGCNFISTLFELPDDLERIINKPWLAENDCTILKGLSGNGNIPKLNTALEKCEWEYNETHFHPDQFATNTENEIEFLSLALESAKRLKHRLAKEFAEKQFRIIVSFGETTIRDNEVEFYGSSTVRFYQIRQECDDIMRIGNLDEYKYDAILELE